MANSNVKVTRSQALAMAIDALKDNADVVEVLQKMKASVEKKNSSSKPKKVTDAQKFLRDAIITVLKGSDKPLTVGEILAKVDRTDAPADAKFSTSSVTANIGVMLTNGKTPNPDGIIVRSVDGKSAKFALVTDTDVDEVDSDVDVDVEGEEE